MPDQHEWSFVKMLSLNLLNSVTRKLKSKRKIAGWNPGPPVKETETLPLSHRDNCKRAITCTEPNSCLSDFSDSLNSMKVLLHLEKTPMTR